MPHIEGIWEIETAFGDIWRLQFPHGGLRQLAGHGLPDAEYVVQHAPGQHGVSHLGYVLKPRTIQMSAAWKCVSLGGHDGLVTRRHLDPYAGLNYLVNPLILRRTLKDGTVRELHEVFYAGGLIRESGNQDRRVEHSAIQLQVNDPVWFDPTERSATADIGTDATGDELVFDTPGGVAGPTAIFGTADYLTFGSSSINVTLNAGEVTTNGDWYSFPTITIVGPASYPEIENQTAGYEITMDYDIPAGRTVTIDLRYGYKTVEDDLGTNLAGYVPATDDLADFCLWPDPLATDGENDIRIFCGGATATTSITIAWYDRYLGV